MKTRSRLGWTVGLPVAGLCALAALGFHGLRAVPRVLAYRQLTTDGQLKGPAPCGWASRTVTDGTRVYFSSPGSSISQVSTDGGEVTKIATPFSCFSFSDISFDRTELLGTALSDGATLDRPLWSWSIASGQAHRLGDLAGHAPSWAPDGQRIAYATGNDELGPNDVEIARRDGGDVRKIASFEKGTVITIRWAPDASALRMILSESSVCHVWEVSASGTDLHPVTLFPDATREVCEMYWTPDGRYSVFAVVRSSGGSDVWAVRERQRWFSGQSNKPVQLTSGPMGFLNTAVAPDSKHIFAVSGQTRGELVRFELSTGRVEPFLSGISAEQLDFSSDRQWVTYVTFPGGALWRSRVDGSDRLQLTQPPLYAVLPRWSPDSQRIVFAGQLPGGHFKIYLISSEGGHLDMISDGQEDQVDPGWTPDGNSVIFGGSVWSVPVISLVDLRTKRVSTIAESKGMYSPRLSPDGRFILALGVPDNRKLFTFDRQTQRWSELLDTKGLDPVGPGWPQWSNDGKNIFFTVASDSHRRSVYRVGLADRKLNNIAAIEVPEGTVGVFGPWLGLTPDGSLLLLRDSSIHEIYAIDVDLP